MNGFLFTTDGELICKVQEPVKISYGPYKDKRVIKVRCTVCGRIRKIQKWKFDFAEGDGANRCKWLPCHCCGDYATKYVIAK